MKRSGVRPRGHEDSMMSDFEGTVEQLLYYNPENGYTIGRFTLDDGQSLTIIGSFAPLSVGERLKISGAWETHPRFGKQFKVQSYLPMLPSSVAGIEKFLSSGLIRGIGPVIARRIVKKFKEKTIEILSQDPDKVLEVEGVGRAKLKDIKKSWSEHRDIRDLVIFLQEHNVSSNLATKIYGHYGQGSYQVLKSNPYQLCLDIWGIGFKTADQIALKLGTDPSSIERVKAYVLYLLEKDNEQGHVFSSLNVLEQACLEELQVPADKFQAAVKALKASRNIVTEDTASGVAVYLPSFHQAQEEVAGGVAGLVSSPVAFPDLDIEAAMAEVEKASGIQFSAMQREAVRECFQRMILVITGGPGTGKTTIIKAVVDIFERWGKSVLLAAPTGRAAKRLSETTRREARTLHRTLEFNPKQGGFKRNARRPLPGDALVVDEFSMVDLPLMHHLLRAVPSAMRLILVGDKDQLPSVGPGCLLRDLIGSGRVPVVRLDEIFRQEKGSLIVLNAHRVNQGQALLYPSRDDRESDFYFFRQENEESVFKTILKLCSYSIPRRLGVASLSPDIQVISPMYRGLVGVDRLNCELQRRLNSSREILKVGNREFKVRDKIMQIRNDYEKDVFNGDIGIITGLDRTRYRIFADFDGRPVVYEKDDLGDITLAYAVSVHKAQGSEYEAVVMPLLTQHYIMLQRNLFYTALTRAKRLSIIIGSYKALHIAIKNDKPVQRNSLLREKILRVLSPEPETHRSSLS